MLYLLMFTAGILVGYSLRIEKKEEDKKNIYKIFDEEVITVDVVNRSMDIMCHELSNYELEGAEYLIRIKTKKIGLLDMTKIDELYELGYKIAKEKLKNNVLKNTY